jgi:molecular chaperone DnaK
VEPEMGKIIGIDLGTTNSVAAFYEGKKHEIILTREGSRLLPSIVAFSKNGDQFVGEAARSQLLTNLDTVYSTKRLMGKYFSEVQPYLSQFNFNIVKAEEDKLKIKIGDQLFAPEEISAMILRKLKESAEEYLNDHVEGAIITVPAYFNDSQRQATKVAGEIAGLNVLRIINEPTAASLSFSLNLKEKTNVLVYDFGGGTIDISVLEIQDEIIKVLATAGDINLGGSDFDHVIGQKLIDEINQEYQINLSDNKMALQRIYDAAETAKKELSNADDWEINLPFIADSPESQPIHLLRYIKREEFNKIIEEKVEKTIKICQISLMKANLSPGDIDEILLVGGSTRIPLVQKKVRDFFQKEPNKRINPDEIVAVGAAIQGSILSGHSKDILLLDVTPLSLGVKTFGGAFTKVIDANTTIPTNRSLVFSTVEDEQVEVEINVYQGEREIAEMNKLLGKFILMGINPAPMGVPRIEVIFNININGILKVTAIDLSTKNKKEIAITHSGLLNDEEIKKIKKEANKFKEADLQKSSIINIKNEITRYFHEIDKAIEDPGLNPDIRQKCSNIMEKSSEIIEKEEPEALEKFLKELKTISKELSFIKTNNSRKATETHEVHTPITSGNTLPGKEKNSSHGDTQKNNADIKKTILNEIYIIEQYLENIDLEPTIKSDCTYIVQKAHHNIENKNSGELKDTYSELEEIKTKLQTIFSHKQNKKTRTEGNIASSPAEKKPGKDKKDDTKPFKILKG